MPNDEDDRSSAYETMNSLSGLWGGGALGSYAYSTVYANSAGWEAAAAHVSSDGSSHSLLGATAGTVTASKAVIVDASKNISTFGKITTNELVVANPTAPASSTATGTKGEIRYDDNYMYVCIATNTWRRAPLMIW